MNVLSKIVNGINAYLKAHVAGLGSAATLLIADLNSKSHLTAGDLYSIIGAYAGAAAAVAIVPNTANPANLADPLAAGLPAVEAAQDVISAA